MQPRLSLIVVIDNFGALFMSLTQVNTDHNVFQLFLTKLAAKLTQDSPGWQRTSYWLVDGAGYHKNPETIAWMQSLGMRVLVAGPYGFQAMPVEMVFAYLKQVDINPQNVQTGKKSKSKN